MGGHSRRWIVVLVLGLSLTFLAGCGGDGDDEESAEGDGDTVVTVTGEETEGDETDTSAEETAEVLEDSLASRDGEIDGVPVRLDIVEFVRSGSTVQLTIGLTNLAEVGGSDAQISDTFDDGAQAAPRSPAEAAGDLDAHTMDGISLIDGTNSKRHLVARDSAGDCVCDGDLSAKFLEPGVPALLSATFGAPPEDVEALDVQIPGFGTFTDVPLE
jgi:hypothetical protein